MNSAKYLANSEQKKTIESITAVVPGRLYTIDYTADYKLDAFIDCGADSLETFGKYAGIHLLDPVKLAAGIAKGKLMKSFGAGCSVFTGFNEKEQPLFCRGYDYPHEPTTLIVKTYPKIGYKSIGVADLGFMEMNAGAFEDGKTDLSNLMLAPYITVDGMNEKGFALGALSLMHKGVKQNTGKKKISTTTAIRMLLDKAATVNEAIELLSNYDLSTPMPDADFQFMMMDKTGVSKIVYYANNELRSLDCKYATNYYVDPLLGENFEEPRFLMMKNFVIEHKDHFEVDDALAMLRCVAANGKSASKSFTVWDSIMNLEDLSVDIVHERDWAHKYHYSL